MAGHMHGSVPSSRRDWIVQRGPRVHARGKLGRALEGLWAAVREIPARSPQTHNDQHESLQRAASPTSQPAAKAGGPAGMPPWPAQRQSRASPDEGCQFKFY